MADRDNRAALWKNDRREKDTHPQLTGQAMIDGREYWVSAWTSGEGGRKPVISMSFKPKDEQRQPRAEALKEDVPFDDPLPF